MDAETPIFPSRRIGKPTRRTRRPKPNGSGNGNGKAIGHGRLNGRADVLPTDALDERKLLEVLTALRKGNFTPRLPVKWTGVAGKVADTVNDVMEMNQRLAKELE